MSLTADRRYFRISGANPPDKWNFVETISIMWFCEKEVMQSMGQITLKKAITGFLLVILSGLALTGCRNPHGQTIIGAVPIIVSNDTFFIGWDSQEPSIASLPSSINSFNLYYRELYGRDWIYLKTTRHYTDFIVLSSQDFAGDGEYEIGIEEVYFNGEKSTIHKSTDFSASPAGGWYLVLRD